MRVKSLTNSAHSIQATIDTNPKNALVWESVLRGDLPLESRRS
jgi:hypothetical protein